MELLYGQADTAHHLAETVSEINAMRPLPDAVIGSIAENHDNEQCVAVLLSSWRSRGSS